MTFFKYDTKVIKSGDVVEVFKYERAITKGYKSSAIKTPRDKTDLVIKENIERSTRRTIQNIRNLINSNFDSKTSFLTLTFAENIKNVSCANYEFQKFRKKLSRIYLRKNKILKYVCVIEFQDGKIYIDKFGNEKKGEGRGAIHYHLLLFDAPYIDFQLIQNKWENGFISINKCDDIDNMGAYLCKYMTKEKNDSRLSGKKRYFASYKTLKKPEIYEIDFNVDVETLYPKKNLVTEYKKDIMVGNDCINSVSYYQYNLKRENFIYKRINRQDTSRKQYLYNCVD